MSKPRLGLQEVGLELQKLLQTPTPLSVACIAGGPCSAALGFSMWHQQEVANLIVDQEIQCQVYDFEAAWAQTVSEVNEAIQTVYPQANVQWRHTCDLLKGLDHIANRTLSNDLLQQKVLLFVLSCTCLQGSGDAAKAPGSFFATLLERLSIGTFAFFIESQFNVPEAFGEMQADNKKLEFCGTNYRYSGLAGVYLFRVVQNND